MPFVVSPPSWDLPSTAMPAVTSTRYDAARQRSCSPTLPSGMFLLS
uniref:Uncharacterized protein n=1 Tax=Arundo donax TaxID=35708 RepID=A0A0A8YNP9_ARUDO